MKNLLLIITITIFVSSSAFAQGAYVGKGNSAYGFFGGYSTGSDVDGYGFGVGYGLKGIVDISYQFSNVQIALRRGSDNQSVHSFGLTMHPLNNQKIPFKISLDMGLSIYERYIAYSIVPIYHLDLRLTKSSFLKLYGGVGYANISLSNRYSKVIKQFGTSLYFNKENKNIFVINLGYSNYNHESTIGISLGMFFGSVKNSPLPKYNSNQNEPNNDMKKKKKRGSYYGR